MCCLVPSAPLTFDPAVSSYLSLMDKERKRHHDQHQQRTLRTDQLGRKTLGLYVCVCWGWGIIKYKTNAEGSVHGVHV